MLPISMFRSSLRALPRTIPRALPRNIPRPHAFPPLRILSSFPRYASGRPPRHPRVIRGRLIPFDPEEAARAKPLINAAEWGRKASSKQAKWIYIFCIGSGVVFYVTHLETVPVSGRRRFMFFGDEAVESDGRKLYQAILNDAHDSLLPAWDPRVRQVQRVMKRLIPACGMENVDWEVHVIQSNGRFAPDISREYDLTIHRSECVCYSWWESLRIYRHPPNRTRRRWSRSHSRTRNST